MTGLDTNVLVRYVMQDDTRQSARATRLIESLNVEAQQNNPNSLLWWTKRLIALRKRYRAFGRGTIEFLSPSNPRVLAFIREQNDERILVIANLSRFVQYVELDLSKYKGMIPIELFGRNPFPAIGELPYLLTLGGHSFYWCSLEQQPSYEQTARASLFEPPTVDDVAFFQGTGLAPVGQILEIRDQFKNLQPQTVSGIDFGLNWSLRTENAGRFSVDIDGTFMDKFSQQLAPPVAELFAARAAGTINRATPLTDVGVAETALAVGRATAHICRQHEGRHRIVIGKDTRLSGYMLEHALTAGICSSPKAAPNAVSRASVMKMRNDMVPSTGTSMRARICCATSSCRRRRISPAGATSEPLANYSKPGGSATGFAGCPRKICAHCSTCSRNRPATISTGG